MRDNFLTSGKNTGGKRVLYFQVLYRMMFFQSAMNHCTLYNCTITIHCLCKKKSLKALLCCHINFLCLDSISIRIKIGVA